MSIILNFTIEYETLRARLISYVKNFLKWHFYQYKVIGFCVSRIVNVVYKGMNELTGAFRCQGTVAVLKKVIQLNLLTLDCQN